MAASGVLLNKAEQFIFARSRFFFCGVIWLISLLKVGVWCIPNLPAYQAIALNPFINPFDHPDAHYLMWSWFTPWLTWLLRLNHGYKFVLFLFACTLSFTAFFMVLVFKLLPDRLARIALVLFMVLPVSTTAYFWVSMDSVTLLLLLLALASPAWMGVTVLSGLALGMQHFEQAFLAISALLLVTSLNPLFLVQTRYTVRFCLLLLAAIVVGKLLLIIIFQHYGIVVNSGRWYFMRQHLHELIVGCFLHADEMIWAVLGLGWLIALRYIDWGKQALPFFIGVFCLSGVIFLVGDQARVLAIVTFPIVVAYWLLNDKFLQQLTTKQVALLFLIWLVLPWFWLWGSERGSVLFFDLGYLLHKAFGWFTLPNDIYAWPF